MNETETNQLLVDAEAKRRRKALETTIQIPNKAGEDLNALLDRVAGLKGEMRAPVQSPDSRIEDLIRNAELPKRHAARKPIEDGSQWSEKLSALIGRLGSGFICAICGEQGLGKTQMGVQLIMANAGRLRTSRFASSMDFFIALKDSFDPNESASERGVINRFSKPGLLVLDEMDERSESAWENRLLFHLINRRYNDMKDTFLISRRNQNEFLASVEKSVASRILETGGIINANWPSFRK